MRILIAAAAVALSVSANGAGAQDSAAPASSATSPDWQNLPPSQMVDGPPPPSASGASAAQGGPRYLAGTWRYPDIDEAIAAWPQAARDNHIEGTVVLDCTVVPTGQVDACVVVSESPAGYGFGNAAVDMFVHYASVDPKSIDGGLKGGEHKTFTYMWRF